MKPKAILLASGGMDSTTLAYWLKHRGIPFEPLFVDYGQHCAKTELETLRRLLPPSALRNLSVVNVSSVYQGSSSRLIQETNLWQEKIDHNDLYLPYRNILLLSIAAARVQALGGGDVYTAFINSNHAIEIDCSSRFFAQLGKLMRAFGGVRVKMPFRYKSKLQVAKIGIRLKAPIGETYSCQVNSDAPCGACPNCVDRIDAIRKLNF